MATWRIEPTWKKSIVERAFWQKDGKTLINEIGWRWGTFEVETTGDEPPTIDEDTDLFCSDEFELGDWSTTDGCWEENEFEGDWEEGEQEELEERLNDGEISVYELEDEGWINTDTEMYITCDVEITKINEDGTEEKIVTDKVEETKEPIKLEPKAEWPFGSN